MTFDQFFQTLERMPVNVGADYLRIDPIMFEGDDEVIAFDGDCFMTRRGSAYHTIIGREEYIGDDVEVSLHVYFDHWVWECGDHTEDFLTQFYGEWLEWQKLPESCALELLMGADINSYQRQWLTHFSDLWDRVVG